MKTRRSRVVTLVVVLVLTTLVTLVAANAHGDRTLAELRPRWASGASKFLELGPGLRVHYRDEGHGEPIVLLHGTGASLHTWDGWAARLRPTHRALRMDLPGFGLTGPDGAHDYSIAHYVAFLTAFVDRLGVDRFHLAGSSLGGHIAWRFAVAHPERVASLVLLDSAGYPSVRRPFAMELARTPGLATVMRWVTPRSLVRQSLLDVYGDDSKVTDALVDRYFDMQLREGNRDAFIERARAAPERADAARIQRIRTPTLVLWGERDEWIPLEHGRRFHRAIAGSELVVVRGAGHVPMEEVPEETASSALRFIAAHPLDRSPE